MVIRASDLPEDAQRAHYERMRHVIDRADRALAETDAWLALPRTEERSGDRWREETDPAATSQAEPVPPIPRPPPRDWDAEARWVSDIAGRKVTAVVMPLAEEIGADLARLDKRIAADAAAVTELLLDQEKRILALERRLLEFEQRTAPPNRPRLMIAGGGSDA